MMEIHSGRGRILAVDVGTGTQDILLYDPARVAENNLKLVLPSQTQILARRISKLEEDLLITGGTMGGGPVSMAIRRHLKKGFRVVMTEDAAKTVRDDLSQVREEGIEIITDAEAADIDLTSVEAMDVDLEMLFGVISDGGEETPETIGVSVQDHGFEQGKSDRKFRFEKIAEMLDSDATLTDFLFEKPPAYYTRMNSVIKHVQRSFSGKVFVVDSKFAAISGVLHDTSARPCLCVDVGNGHTMAAVVGEGGRLDSVFEHHTHSLTRERLTDYLVRLADGKVTNEEVYSDHGHGCHIKNAPGIGRIEKILVTGPNRGLLSGCGLPIEFARPFGDVMMTGTVGIIDLIKNHTT
ncbi:MAG TPA: hypothetical protein ENH13_00355 [Euryarchaeota archaeon]|nr:hypothetical protein [Euryarchaeota archaeon]